MSELGRAFAICRLLRKPEKKINERNFMMKKNR
jgi:hypothetical protein